MRQQLVWVLRGRARTQAALDQQTTAIQQVQQQVAELSEVVARLADRLPAELRATVDDISARSGALADRLATLELAMGDGAR